MTELVRELVCELTPLKIAGSKLDDEGSVLEAHGSGPGVVHPVVKARHKLFPEKEF